MLENYTILPFCDDIIKKYFDSCKTSSIMQLGNDVLYKLCEEHLEHTKDDVIFAKLWLIGRSYAAAIERRKKYNDLDASEDFYIDYVIPTVKAHAKLIDSSIKNIQNIKDLNEETSISVLRLHMYLTKLFDELSGYSKRSLASKYLHFHCPKMFFIYDSRANDSIKQFIKVPAIPFNNEFDLEYANFYYKALKLTNYIKEHYNKPEFTPRDLDNLLLFNKDKYYKE